MVMTNDTSKLYVEDTNVAIAQMSWVMAGYEGPGSNSGQDNAICPALANSIHCPSHFF